MILIAAAMIFSLCLSSNVKAMQGSGEPATTCSADMEEKRWDAKNRNEHCLTKMPNEPYLATWLYKDGLQGLMERTRILEYLAGKEIPIFLVMVYVKKAMSECADHLSKDPYIKKHLRLKSIELYPELINNPEELEQTIYGTIARDQQETAKTLCTSISNFFADSNQHAAKAEFDFMASKYLGQ